MDISNLDQSTIKAIDDSIEIIRKDRKFADVRSGLLAKILMDKLNIVANEPWKTSVYSKGLVAVRYHLADREDSKEGRAKITPIRIGENGPFVKQLYTDEVSAAKAAKVLVKEGCYLYLVREGETANVYPILPDSATNCQEFVVYVKIV